jgi:hypothetical protein
MQRRVFCLCLPLAFASCALQPIATAPPPPPTSPVIAGNFRSVSSSDIRQVLTLMRKRISKDYHTTLPIYEVYVVDRDHISFEYWPEATETHAYARRIEGHWRLEEEEAQRISVKGPNLPTG